MNSSTTFPLEVYLLGLVDFEDAQLLQRRLVYELGERHGGALILCEHPPTISVGRIGSRAHVRADDDELHALGIRMRWVNRGGGCVLHLPGQLVAYLVMSLEPLGLELATYVRCLQTVVLNVLDDFDLGRSARALGSSVLVGEQRVASLGVAVTRWVAYHGIALNVGPFLAPFQLLDEPDPAGATIRYTSMEAHRQRPIAMSRIREAIIRHVEQVFGLERNVLFTTHPLIRRKPIGPVYAQSHS